jgi:OOP family OmpA-OmpF porin
MDLMNMLKSHFNEAKIKELATKMGESTETVKKAVEGILPSVMGGLSSKLSFLDKDGDGDITNDIKKMFGMGDAAAPKAADVMDGKAEEVTAMVSKSSGLSEEKTKSLLDEITGQATQFLGGLADKTGIDFKGLASSIQTQGAGMFESLDKQLGSTFSSLDKDGDGKIMDDIQDMGKNLLGGLFGKK